MTVANEVEKRPGAGGNASARKTADVSGAARSDGNAERDRLRMMMLIRRFEEKTYQEYTKKGTQDAHGNTVQKIGGFCHLYSGQEAIAVGIATIFQKGKDYLVTGYRCHGHSLALGMHPRAEFAELFGKAPGC